MPEPPVELSRSSTNSDQAGMVRVNNDVHAEDLDDGSTALVGGAYRIDREHSAEVKT